MIKELVTQTKRRIVSSRNKFHKVLFHYPKLVLIDSVGIDVIDVEVNEEKDFHFTNFKVEDAALFDNILWILHDSGKLVVIDLLRGTSNNVDESCYCKHRIREFLRSETNTYLVTESGECLTLVFSAAELAMNIKEGKDIHISVLKVPASEARGILSRSDSLQLPNKNLVKIIKGKMMMECPITGLNEIVSAATINTDLQYIFSWNDYVVLSDTKTLWVLDLISNEILTQSPLNELTYWLMGAQGNNFYFLAFNDKENIISCIQEETVTPRKENQLANGSMRKMYSEENLKNQIKTLIETVISSNLNSVDVINQFKSFFTEMNDVSFLIEVITQLCQKLVFYKPLLFILQVKAMQDNELNMINQLWDTIYKIDIIEYINFKGNNNYDGINLFEYDFKDLCKLFIQKNDFDLASICWLKFSEMSKPLNSTEILSVLNVIPQNTKLAVLVIWFKNFVPTLLDHNPYNIDVIIRWTTERVFLLENSTYWPKIGLKLIEEVTAVLESSLKTIALKPISMDEIETLKSHLVNIMELKEKYKINLLLGELSSQNPTEVALIMLHRCYSEDLDLFLKNYLPNYSIRYYFEMDDVLRSYVEVEAASGGGNIDGNRLQIVLNAFRVPSYRLDCLLNVLRILDVPWSEIILNMAVNFASIVSKDFTSSEIDLKLAKSISEEVNYAKVKIVLKKYNYALTFTDYTLVIHKIVSMPAVDLNDLNTIRNISTKYNHYGTILYLDRCLQDNNTREALNYFTNLSVKKHTLVLKSLLCKYKDMIQNKDVNKSAVERCYLDFFKGSNKMEELQLTQIEKLYYMKHSQNTSTEIKEEPLKLDIQPKFDLSCAGSDSRKLIIFLRRIPIFGKVRCIIENVLSLFSSHVNVSDDILAGNIKGNIDLKDSSDILLLCSRIVVQLIELCPEEYLYFLTRVLSILIAVINSSIVIKNLTMAWKFHYIYMPCSSFSDEQDLLNCYSNINNENEFNYLDHYKTKSDFVPFRILASLIDNKKQSLEGVSEHYKEKIVKRLLHKNLTLIEVDELFTTNLLNMLYIDDKNDISTWLIDNLKGHSENLPAHVITYLTSPTIQHIFGLNDLPIRDNIAYPPHYILKSKYNLTLADIALPDITEETWDVKIVLYYVLKQQSSLPLKRLYDLCDSLNVSIDDGLSLQLLALLTTWELTYKITPEEFCNQRIIIENNEKELLAKSLLIWESIRKKDFITDILSDFWKNGEVSFHGRIITINPYYYEIYLIIYKLLYKTSSELRKTKEYFLLNYLKNYTRKSNPHQYEFELFSAKGTFPEIGHFRLPFHMFMRDDMWSNLKSEITLETYDTWLPAVAILNLDNDSQVAKDMICSNALKQTMKTHKPDEDNLKESECWRLYTREEPLLRAAHRCVRNISNMEWAGACLFYVLQGCGRGADQVAAAHLCYQFSQRWEALQPGNRAVRKMERLHATLSTRHALHKIEWTNDELTQLLTEPSQLIRAMYQHPQFMEKIMKYDVNSAVNEIAEKNAINVSTIRGQILESILEKSIITNTNKTLTLDNIELVTAKYILKATCPKMGAIYLSRIVFDEETDYNKCKKIRALQCLMSILDPDTSLKVTYRERDILWHSLLDLKHIMDLDSLEMPWATGAYRQDKQKALEQILPAIENNKEGLKIMAELVYRYGGPQIKAKVIGLLLRVSMYDEMLPLLLNILSPPNDILCMAWKKILLTPFQSADYPITEKQKVCFIKTINLLPLCPVISDDVVKEIWKHCVRCKCYGIGCLVLPYMTHESRSGLAELKKIDRRNLVASLKNLNNDTFLVAGAMHLIENIISKNVHR